MELTKTSDGSWTLASMPGFDVELEVEYYTDEEVAEMEEAAFTEGVELTKTGANEWTLAATPGFDVELEVEYETALALSETTDNSAALTEWDGYEADVTMTRTLAAGSYNTFAAPFSTAIPDGWTVKELTSATFADGTLTLNFANAASIEAGKPYLVKVAANTDLSTAPFTGAIVSKDAQPFTSTDVDFIPTLGATNDHSRRRHEGRALPGSQQYAAEPLGIARQYQGLPRLLPAEGRDCQSGPRLQHRLWRRRGHWHHCHWH